MLAPQNGLPGSIGLAVQEGALPPDAPGLDQLSALIRPLPEGFAIHDKRIDEIRWPIKNDASIALVAADAYPSIPSVLQPSVDAVRRWLSGEPLTYEALRHHWHLADARFFPSSMAGAPPDQLLMIFTKIHGDDLPADVHEAFTHALSRPIEDLRGAEIATALLSAAMNAEHGWFAYHAHRRLASFVAEEALRALTLCARANVDVWPRAIQEALRLARSLSPIP